MLDRVSTYLSTAWQSEPARSEDDARSAPYNRFFHDFGLY